MWPSAEEISADLASGDAERVQEALDAITLRLDLEEPVDLAPVGTEALAALGPDVDEDAQLALMRLWAEYPGWRPALSAGERAWQTALLAICYGNTRIALEASLLVKDADDPAGATAALLERLAARGVAAGEVPGATALVSYLLAGKAPVRAAVVAALAGFDGELARVRAGVAGELEDHERG